MKKMDPVYPGEILFEEFLIPMNLSQNKIANDIGVPLRRINESIYGKRRIAADTALRLAHYLNMSQQFRLGLQMILILMLMKTGLLSAQLKKSKQTKQHKLDLTFFAIFKRQSSIFNSIAPLPAPANYCF